MAKIEFVGMFLETLICSHFQGCEGLWKMFQVVIANNLYAANINILSFCVAVSSWQWQTVLEYLLNQEKVQSTTIIQKNISHIVDGLSEWV